MMGKQVAMAGSKLRQISITRTAGHIVDVKTGFDRPIGEGFRAYIDDERKRLEKMQAIDARLRTVESGGVA